ncbi:hypothetical protein ACFYXH_22615 [Streptomyces sp. NPDC002730]|uniref:hypothetical protein n=1 Tax=Streptomyces sp. NPDC002730 TaxID=3364662 RepID=UPI00367688F7
MRHFELAIHNAVVAENHFRAQQTASIRTKEAELASARADTGPQEAARRDLAAVRARQDDDQKLTKALAELEAARDRWEGITGRRPPA